MVANGHGNFSGSTITRNGDGKTKGVQSGADTDSHQAKVNILSGLKSASMSR